jgi:hypothetical protein
MLEQTKSAAEQMAHNMIWKSLTKDPSPIKDFDQEHLKEKFNPVTSVKPNLKSYIGTKVILGRPMTEDEFLITVRGKTKEEVHQQETQGNGYEVTYEDGYVSWSPKGVFERCYREITGQEKGLISTAQISPKK